MKSETSELTTKLYNSHEIPICGLGTYLAEDLDVVVYEAIKAGVRLFDSAWYYKNEVKIGLGFKKAIEDKLVTREELTYSSKIFPSEFYRAEECLKEQLKDLQLDYIDIYQLHWSVNFEKGIESNSVPVHKIWELMESFVEKKLVKSIGVCNFNVQLLCDLLIYAKIKPVVNQIEFHPYLQQPGLINFCHRNGVRIIAFNSLVSGPYIKSEKKLDIFSEPILIEIAKKYEKSVAQILLIWAISKNMIVIPKSKSINRIVENFSASSYRLPKEDIEKIDSLDKNIRLLDPEAIEIFS